MYSDMSKRTRARSLPKRKAARLRATSVLPTPGGPEEEEASPPGRFGFLSPARVRRMARATALIALSWDTMRWCSSSSMRRSFCRLLFLDRGDGDARPLRDHLVDVALRDLVAARRRPCSQCSRTMCRFSRWATSSSRKKPPALDGARRGPPPPGSCARTPAASSGAGGVAQLHPAARLVEEVDGLVGQEAVGDVAARLVDRRLERLVAGRSRGGTSRSGP